MKIGVPTETTEGERRVALVPEVVRKLTGEGLDVVVERGAGAGALIPDSQYEEAGAHAGRSGRGLGLRCDRQGRAAEQPRRPSGCVPRAC